MLNTAIATLMKPSHDRPSTISGEAPRKAAAVPATTAPMPMATLTAGPARAIRPAAPGVRGSLSSMATPPRANKVIPLTPTPLFLATTEWPNSWATIDAMKATETMVAMTK